MSSMCDIYFLVLIEANVVVIFAGLVVVAAEVVVAMEVEAEAEVEVAASVGPDIKSSKQNITV